MKELLKLLLFFPLSDIYFSVGSLYYKNEIQLLIRFSRCSRELAWYRVKLQYLYMDSNYIDEHCRLLKRVFGVLSPFPETKPVLS